MCRFRAALLCASALLLPMSSWPSDGEITLFFEKGGFKCTDEIPCAGSGVVYVFAILEGASTGGITGVEYGLEIGVDSNADPGWIFAETFAPGATVALGNGFNPPDTYAGIPERNRLRGVNIAYSSCQTGDGRMILLETVEVRNTQCTPGALPLLVASHDRESNRRFLCPLFTLCDGPTFTKVCLGTNVHPCGVDAQCSTSGRAIINPEPGQTAPCPAVAVTVQTWSLVKTLYRD